MDDVCVDDSDDLTNLDCMQETHEDPHYQGLYDAGAACPSWAKDWDCMLDGDANREELPDAYNKVACHSHTRFKSRSRSTLSRQMALSAYFLSVMTRQLPAYMAHASRPGSI